MGSGSSNDDQVFNDTGPTDRTHYIRFGIGLQSGDQTQSAWFDFFVIDNAINAEVGTFRDSGRNWVTTGQYTKFATVATHVGGGFDAHVVIHNPDSQSQCFIVFARRQTS